jgi:2-desacetyl-2-hydroxyethyl bacteriochlorophyllide A dehydrogenase
MKALMLNGVRDVSLHEVPVAPVTPRSVKIRVKRCGLCGTDHSKYVGKVFLPGKFPFFLGHEISGIVQEVGAEVTDIAPGQMVSVNTVRFCGDCYRCRNGQENYCERLVALWSPNGGFSEYVVLDRQQVFVIPEEITLDQAAFVEPVAVCVHCIDMAEIKPGMSVAITGAGSVGLILLQMAIRAGASFTLVSEPSETKRGLAKKFGADIVIDPTKEDVVAKGFAVTNFRGFDVVIEASGNPAAAPQAFALTGPRATLFYLAVFPIDFNMPVNLYTIYAKEMTIKGVFLAPYSFPRAISLLPKLDVDCLISHHVSLEDSPTIFELYDRPDAIKILVDCD